MRQTNTDVETNATELAALQNRADGLRADIRWNAKCLQALRHDRVNAISHLSAADAYNWLYPLLTIAHAPVGTDPRDGIQWCPLSSLRATLQLAGPGPLERPDTHNPAPPHASFPDCIQGPPCFVDRTHVEEGDGLSWGDADAGDGWTNDGSN